VTVRGGLFTVGMIMYILNNTGLKYTNIFDTDITVLARSLHYIKSYTVI